MEAQLMENARVDYVKMRQDRRYSFEQHWSHPLGKGVMLLHYQIGESARRKHDSLCHLRVWGGVGPRESQKYSPESIRDRRRLTGYHLWLRNMLSLEFYHPMGLQEWTIAEYRSRFLNLYERTGGLGVDIVLWGPGHVVRWDPE